MRKKIAIFGNSYNRVVHRIIQDSKQLDRKGEVFIKCASLILSNFKMTRSGPFKEHENQKEILVNCWNEIGEALLKIHNSIIESGLSRERILVELDESQLEELTSEIWLITKEILPFIMGKTTYGLVGASKILFAVLPEIVLPVDNRQWLHLFKTVDISDVIKRMVIDIKEWESVTGKRLNEMDASKMLITLPSVYNVMAMAARPNITTIKRRGSTPKQNESPFQKVRSYNMPKNETAETLTDFITRLTNDIPCYAHQRNSPREYSLTKHNTIKPRHMCHFATVYDKPRRGQFKIITKEWLADDECKQNGILGRWGYGTELNGTTQLGVLFFVNKGSRGGDYQQVLRCLRIVKGKV